MREREREREKDCVWVYGCVYALDYVILMYVCLYHVIQRHTYISYACITKSIQNKKMPRGFGLEPPGRQKSRQLELLFRPFFVCFEVQTVKIPLKNKK